MSLCNLFRLRQNRQFCRQHAALLHQNLRCFPRIGRHKSIYYIVTASRSLQPHACLWVHTLPAIPQNPSVGCVRYARGLSKLLPFPPTPKVVWTPFSDDLLPLCKTRMPTTISPNVARTSKLQIFQQLLGNKPCPVSTRSPCSRPTSSNAVCCIFSRARFAMSKNFRRALSGGGVRFGKLFGMAEAG